MRFLQIFNDTGDQDLCYFNFLCAHQLGRLSDFNHVYSNIGYVMLGLLFIVVTGRRDVMRRKAYEDNRAGLERRVIIQQTLFFFSCSSIDAERMLLIISYIFFL